MVYTGGALGRSHTYLLICDYLLSYVSALSATTKSVDSGVSNWGFRLSKALLIY